MFYAHHTIPMSATGVTPWIDARRLGILCVQTDCGDVDSPVGVITMESTNDIPQIEAEKNAGVDSASSTAKYVSHAVTPAGTAWASGYDGNGAKASFSPAGNIAACAFVRVRYTRTSGGTGDTLNVRWSGKLGYA